MAKKKGKKVDRQTVGTTAALTKKVEVVAEYDGYIHTLEFHIPFGYRLAFPKLSGRADKFTVTLGYVEGEDMDWEATAADDQRTAVGCTKNNIKISAGRGKSVTFPVIYPAGKALGDPAQGGGKSALIHIPLANAEEVEE